MIVARETVSRTEEHWQNVVAFLGEAANTDERQLVESIAQWRPTGAVGRPDRVLIWLTARELAVLLSVEARKEAA